MLNFGIQDKSSRISGIVPGVGRRYAYRRRISLPFGIHTDRLSPMLRLARAVEGINSCLVAMCLLILLSPADIPGYRRVKPPGRYAPVFGFSME